MWLMLIIFIVSLILCILANINYYRSLAIKGEDNVWLLKFNDFIVLSMFASSSIFLENVFNLSEQKFSIRHLLCFAIGFALSYAVKGLTRDACQKKWENKNTKTVIVRQMPDSMKRIFKYLELATALAFCCFFLWGAFYLWRKGENNGAIISAIIGVSSLLFFIVKLKQLIHDKGRSPRP